MTKDNYSGFEMGYINSKKKPTKEEYQEQGRKSARARALKKLQAKCLHTKSVGAICADCGFLLMPLTKEELE